MAALSSGQPAIEFTREMLPTSGWESLPLQFTLQSHPLSSARGTEV
jgi:hypothetical protein